MKPISSVTTTIPREAVSAIGTLHGGLGLQTQRSSAKIAAWLAGKNPADMDKVAVSRALSHGVGLRVRHEGRFPSGPNGERLPSYTLASGCDIRGDPESIASALRDLRNFMTPATPRQIEGWIARMSVVTAKRKDDDFSEELRIMEYSSRLAIYPADVVHHVLIKDTYKFFPTWDELHKRCEALTSPRAHMIAALERGPEPPEPVRRPPTDDERARVKALVNEMFGDVPQACRDEAVDQVIRGDCMGAEECR